MLLLIWAISYVIWAVSYVPKVQLEGKKTWLGASEFHYSLL